MSFVAELRRRNVIRMAGLYLVGAWLVVQVAGTLLPVFEAPAWVMKVLVGVLAVALVPVLAFSWVFELTPEGIRRDEEVPPGQSIAPRTARRMDRMIIAVLAIALAFFAFDRLVLAPRRDAALVAATKQSVAKEAEAKPSPDARSIAVLPFENLSAEKDNEYFASGMQDMILTKLAEIGELKVTSRSSTEKYKSRPDNLKAIAQELGVARILEGSVQKAGDQVLINVQLIDAATDRHLWAQAYTRTLDNIFGVEGEVATRIAEALKTKLTPAEAAAVARIPTQDKEAYEAYLKANYYLRNANRSGDRDELARAVPLLQHAVQLDPRFGKAYSLLALTYTKLTGHAEEQAVAARKALEINPDDASALIQVSFVHSELGEHDQATDYARRAVRSEPGSMHVESGAGWTYAFAGRFEDSVAFFKRAVEIDPTSSTGHAFVAYALAELRRYEEARDALRAGLARDPDDTNSVQALAEAHILGWGDLDAAREVLRSASQGPQQAIPIAQGWYEVDLLSRDYPAALAVLDQAPAGVFTQGSLTKAHYQLQVFQAQGDVARARKAALDARDQLQVRIKAAPELPALHASLALALVGVGDCGEAMSEARRAVDLQPISRNAVWGVRWAHTQAQVLARCGRADDAIAQLRHLLEIPAGIEVSVPWLKLDPAWDPIRTHPRFLALLSKAGNHD